MRFRALLKLQACLILAALASTARAEISVPSFFGDRMVVQRDVAFPIWGQAEAGETVTVSFAKESVQTVCDDDGQWRVDLPATPASKKPRSLIIAGTKDRVEIKQVLVGDVWLGSGQSNMAGRVSGYAKNDETLANLVDRSPFPNLRLMQSGPKPTWTDATRETVSAFSALHFSFGQRLQQELDVPIGLIVGAVGGTPSGYWIPPETFDSSPKCKADIWNYAKTYDHARAMKQHEAKLAVWEKRVAAAEAEGKKPRGRKPSPPAKPGQSSRGGKIGGLYEKFIKPVAGYRIRGVLWDQGEARSGVVGVDQHTMMSELIRGWREAWGQGDFAFLFVQKPSGGGCAFSNEDPISRDGDPFVTSLPDITRLDSGDQRYLYVRLMHDNTNSWMVPASDLGSGIHPRNKWGYGNRAAQVALSQVYQTGVQAYGPIYRSHEITGDRVTIEFDQTGKGLTAAHGQLQGFALTDGKGQWHWANAKISGDQVVVWSDAVSKPTGIRYAFANKRAWANLFNKDGLPALAFEIRE